VTARTSDIEKAAGVLRAGGLVALPTETVYGLGANAEDPAAVARIFQVKGRPLSHPLIVHIGGAEQLDDWLQDVPQAARLLAEHFWPGPLTLVLRRGSRVPLEATGGLETVAVRVPDHPVALALLSAFGGGVTAPSANRFGSVSPTTADHVRAELGEAVDFVLDGGPCGVGVESTIVDVTGEVPSILRPGGVTREDLEAVLGHPLAVHSTSRVRVPGQHPSHYAPRARVVLVESGARVSKGLPLSVLGGDARDVGRGSGHDGADVFGDQVGGPVPPGCAQQPLDVGVVEALPDRFGRVAADDRVGRDVGGDYGAGRDDGAVANPYAGHDHRPVPEPDVVADDCVAAAGHGGDDVQRLLGSPAAEHGERVRRDAHRRVLGAGHQEGGSGGDRAVLADGEALRPVGVEDVAVLEVRGAIRVVVVGVLAHADVR
jgi:L-threonylcarbamoyladenylate synthase